MSASVSRSSLSTFSANAQQADARLGQLGRMAPAQQHRSEAMLEIGYRLAYGGLRQVQPLGGTAEAARLDHRLEAAVIRFVQSACWCQRFAFFADPRQSVGLMGPSSWRPPYRAPAQAAAAHAPHEHYIQPIEIHKGLEGVVADSTALSLVDGEGGHLVLPRVIR